MIGDSSQKDDDADALVVNNVVQVKATVERTDSSSLRHTSRHRNIRHKKLAMMDSRALNEVCVDGSKYYWVDAEFPQILMIKG